MEAAESGSSDLISKNGVQDPLESEIMNTQLAKLNRFGETSDPGISAEIAGHAIVSGPLRSEETLSTLAWALGSDGAMCRISPQPFPSATYFPELLSTLAGQALTAHWDYPAWK